MTDLSALIPLLQEYWDTKEILVKKEAYILKECGFHLEIEHPHKFLMSYLKILDAQNDFAQHAWNYLNDLYVVPVRMEVFVSFCVPCVWLCALSLYLSLRVCYVLLSL